MKVTQGIFLKIEKEKFENTIEKQIKSYIKHEHSKYFDSDIEIGFIIVKDKDADKQEENQYKFFMTASLNDIKIKSEKIKFSDLYRMLTLIDNMIISMEKQQSCEHQYVSVKDMYGKDLNNGDIECEKCGFRSISKEEKYNNGKVAKSISAKYSCRKEWDHDTFVQCGSNGIVFSKEKHYNTAFFEAFPKIINNKDSVFIRGEGKDIIEAEEVAWNKYQKALNCKNHEWTRNFKGEERTDGYAKCVHCGISGTFLEPTTKCIYCDEKTTNIFKKDYVCKKHYYEKHTIQEIIDDRKHNSLIEDYTDEEKILINNYETIFETINKELYKLIDYKNEKEGMIINAALFVMEIIKVKIYKFEKVFEILSETNIHEIKHDSINKLYNVLFNNEKNKEIIKSFILGERATIKHDDLDMTMFDFSEKK